MIRTSNIPYISVEINEVFKVLSNDVLSRIPEHVISFFKDNATKDYSFKYDVTKSLDKQKFRTDTREMLAIIYKDYICNDEERIEYIKLRKSIDIKKEDEKRKKYNSNDLFNSNNNNEKINDNNKLIELSTFDKIILFIKSILKKVNNRKD